MKITTLEEYGLRCAMQLARVWPSGSQTIPEIADREGISTAYAAKLLNLLKRGNVVAGVRGRTGGYSLTRPASEVTVSDVLRAMGEPAWEHTSCTKFTGVMETCVHTSACSIRSLWGNLDSLLTEILRDITLEDLMNRRTGVPQIRLHRVSPKPSASLAVEREDA